METAHYRINAFVSALRVIGVSNRDGIIMKLNGFPLYLGDLEAVVRDSAHLYTKPTDRTPEQYAIEHAEYLAVSAERLVDAVNALGELEVMEDETGDAPDPEALREREEARSDAMGAVREMVYEFRKRAARCASPGVDNANRK